METNSIKSDVSVENSKNTKNAYTLSEEGKFY